MRINSYSVSTTLLCEILGNELLRETERGGEDTGRFVHSNKRIRKVEEAREVAIVVVAYADERCRHISRNTDRVLDVQALSPHGL